MPSRCPVVELRQYTLHPGGRDALIELFEREFIDGQEASGMSVIDQFRDLDDPERFVWLRGFRGMEARRAALAAFYGGPVWEAHREAANATMLDSGNALLLRPVGPHGGFVLEERSAREASAATRRLARGRPGRGSPPTDAQARGPPPGAHTPVAAAVIPGEAGLPPPIRRAHQTVLFCWAPDRSAPLGFRRRPACINPRIFLWQANPALLGGAP